MQDYSSSDHDCVIVCSLKTIKLS